MSFRAKLEKLLKYLKEENSLEKAKKLTKEQQRYIGMQMMVLEDPTSTPEEKMQAQRVIYGLKGFGDIGAPKSQQSRILLPGQEVKQTKDTEQSSPEELKALREKINASPQLRALKNALDEVTDPEKKESLQRMYNKYAREIGGSGVPATPPSPSPPQPQKANVNDILGKVNDLHAAGKIDEAYGQLKKIPQDEMKEWPGYKPEFVHYGGILPSHWEEANEDQRSAVKGYHDEIMSGKHDDSPNPIHQAHVKKMKELFPKPATTPAPAPSPTTAPATTEPSVPKRTPVA
jgi:hypothetical protein